jgi:hypothetical protein
MSKKRQSSGEDYPDAASKHCSDARSLLDEGRPDGAAYLAGYAVECILKTLIQVGRGGRAVVKGRGHDLNALGADATRLASLPTSRIASYFRGGPLAALPYAAPPAGWKETLRYYPEGTISPALAKAWTEEAERLYTDVVGELKKNGEV